MPRFSAINPTHCWLNTFLLAGLLCCGNALSSNTDSAHAVSAPAAFDVPREVKAFPTESNSKSLQILTWNIDRGSRFDAITNALVKDPGDLELLQEVDMNTHRSGGLDVAAELAKRLRLNMSYGIEFEELSQGGDGQSFIGQATLTRLPMRRSRVLRFQHQSNFWKPHAWLPSSIPLMQRRLGSRIALVTELEFAGKPLVVYNAHLESRSGGKIQNEQLDEMLADLKRYPAGTAAIIAGDLNTKYFPSTFLHKLEREGFRSSTGERIERTHTIMMALDWIFARGSIVLSGGEVRKSVKGSDHYPIYAQMRAE